MLRLVSQPNESFPKVIKMTVESELLAQNPAGEDHLRPLAVYLPKQAENPDLRFPVLYCLAPWTNAGRSLFDWQPFKESLFDRVTRLIEQGQMPPCVIVCPDLYTSFGGSQFINSDYLGPHGDFLVKELFPFVEQHFPVRPGFKNRGAFGRSSGGFGSLRLAMDYPNEIAAVACHSGDMGFDLVYRPDLVDLCKTLDKYNGDVEQFISYCQTAKKIGGREVHVLMLLGMAATYSPDLGVPLGYQLPIDLRSGVIEEELWQNWRKNDPVHMLKSHNNLQRLSQLSALYIECGTRDQYNLLYGARQFSDHLNVANVEHHYFEFDDNHSGTSYRYDVSLPLILAALT
ncbi:MAG: esterase [Pseudobacteriovorax sp.]|nr:esterase [Pseudobacteriovorax sp.]